MKIGLVLGTRPEVIKNYSVIKAFRDRGEDLRVLYTNQHSIASMSEAIFQDMGFSPDVTMPGPYTFGAAVDWMQNQITDQGIELIIVNGDTAAALVGALSGMYEDIRIAHIEAGLRSFDNQMYEERHRIMVDAIAHYLLTYTEYEQRYLESLPDLRGQIHCVGNTTVDVVNDFSDRIVAPDVENYAYVTLHRKELTDSAERLRQVFSVLNTVSFEFDRMVFPIHPRTRDAMCKHGIREDALSNIDVRPPLTAFESLSYVKNARLIITDSGCVQEEAYIFNVPCVTLRENTERHLTVENGANIVTGFDYDDMRRSILVQANRPRRNFPPIYGPTGAGERIAQVLLDDRASSLNGFDDSDQRTILAS